MGGRREKGALRKTPKTLHMTDFTLTPEFLLRAYASGIFPMSDHRDDPEVFWVEPKRRGILPLDGFHVSRSLARRIRRAQYRITLNHAFADVVDGCADRPDTWINREIRTQYGALHDLGHAHSLEVWQNGTLTGGVYGVSLGAAFFGESMFSRATDASKLALCHLVDHLRLTGFCLFDTQFLTDHLASLGVIEISRAAYRAQLDVAVSQDADITKKKITDCYSEVLQRMTQMS